MDEGLKKVRDAYDRTVEMYHKGKDPFDDLPSDFRESDELRTFIEENSGHCNSGNPDIKEFLDPQKGMKYLDLGCCANLANYRLDLWPSIYYGVDFSPALINAMKKFAEMEELEIGGLYNREINSLPFKDNFFDIASMIGVLEYCSIEYTGDVLKELSRVLKGEGRVVIDFPNDNHPSVETMYELEERLNRPNVKKTRREFEEFLKEFFKVERVDDSKVMIKYFCVNK